MATGNVRQGRSTNRPEHYGNFGCRQDLHENSRLGNIPVNSRVCRKSHVFAFSVLSHVRFFRHFHKACHIRRICRIVSQTISGDPSCAANMFPLLFGRQETACSSATSVRPRTTTYKLTDNFRTPAVVPGLRSDAAVIPYRTSARQSG